MTRQTKEKIVLLVSNGKNSYSDLQQVLSADEIDFAVTSPAERILKEQSPRPRPKDDVYTYKPMDKFSLTEYGQDILDDVLRQQHQEDLILDNLRLVRWTLAATVLGLIIALCK